MSNEPTIEQMNEAIARFMGYDQQEQDFRRPNNTLVFLIEKFWTPIHHLKYHSSWDWLMPVVEKIEKHHAHVRIQAAICTITYRYMQLRRVSKEQGIPMNDIMPIAEHNEHGFIGNVFHAVYDFIQWHNNNQNTTNDTTAGNIG